MNSTDLLVTGLMIYTRMRRVRAVRRNLALTSFAALLHEVLLQYLEIPRVALINYSLQRSTNCLIESRLTHINDISDEWDQADPEIHDKICIHLRNHRLW